MQQANGYLYTRFLLFGIKLVIRNLYSVFSFSTHHRVRLQNHGKHNQENTYPKGETYFQQLTKQYSRNGNAVHRLKVVRHVHRECSQFAKCLQLKEEGDDGEYRTQCQERNEVTSIRYHRFGRVEGTECGDAQCKKQYSTYQLL